MPNPDKPRDFTADPHEPYPRDPVAADPNFSLHPSTFDYLKPSAMQLRVMALLRHAALDYAKLLDTYLPAGPDKTFILRSHRTTAAWVAIALTRHADGTPRDDSLPL